MDAPQEESPVYEIELTAAARRDLKRLPRDILERIDACLRALAEDPKQPGVVKLAGEDCLYRRRVGDYRIIFQRRDEERLLVIARIRHRKDAYR